MSLQGNNNASSFLDYNTLDPGPGPGMSLLVRRDAISSGVSTLYIEKAFGGTTNLVTEGVSPGSGLQTLFTHSASGKNENTTLNIQAPTTNKITAVVKGFRE